MTIAYDRRAQPTHAGEGFELTRSYSRARAFLRDGARSDGLYEDFVTLAGPSVDWVSGFVLSSLGATAMPFDHPEDGAWRRGVVSLTRRQRPNGGWAYSERV